MGACRWRPCTDVGPVASPDTRHRISRSIGGVFLQRLWITLRALRKRFAERHAFCGALLRALTDPRPGLHLRRCPVSAPTELRLVGAVDRQHCLGIHESML